MKVNHHIKKSISITKWKLIDEKKNWLQHTKMDYVQKAQFTYFQTRQAFARQFFVLNAFLTRLVGKHLWRCKSLVITKRQEKNSNSLSSFCSNSLPDVFRNITWNAIRMRRHPHSGHFHHPSQSRFSRSFHQHHCR